MFSNMIYTFKRIIFNLYNLNVKNNFVWPTSLFNYGYFERIYYIGNYKNIYWYVEKNL